MLLLYLESQKMRSNLERFVMKHELLVEDNIIKNKMTLPNAKKPLKNILNKATLNSFAKETHSGTLTNF